MKNKHLILGAGIALLLAAGAYGACAMEVTSVGEELTPPDPPITVPTMEPRPPESETPPVVDDPDSVVINPRPRPEPGMPEDPRPIDPPSADPSVELPTPNGPVVAAPNRGQPFTCGTTMCQPDELCCPHESRCVAADCPGCCNGENDRPGPGEVGMPDIDPTQ